MRVDMDVQCHQSPARIRGLRHERLASPAELPYLIEPAQVGDAGIIGDAFAQRMLCKGGHQLAARGAARCCVLVAVEAEIGRASGRERVCQYGEISGVAVSLKTKQATEKG